MNLNKVLLIGRVTQDPEARSTNTGATVASFSIATNRYWKGQDGSRQESTEFHNIVAWSRLAEIASQYLKKGALVMIEGRLQTRSWDGQDGVKRYRTEVVAENMQLGPRAGGAAPMQGNNPPPHSDDDNLPTIQQDDFSVPPAPAQPEVNVEDIPF